MAINILPASSVPAGQAEPGGGVAGGAGDLQPRPGRPHPPGLLRPLPRLPGLLAGPPHAAAAGRALAHAHHGPGHSPGCGNSDLMNVCSCRCC